MDLDRTVLPHPDSPTRPKVRPARSSRLTPSTADTLPVRVSNRTLRSRIFKRGASFPLTGSRSAARAATVVTGPGRFRCLARTGIVTTTWFSADQRGEGRRSVFQRVPARRHSLRYVNLSQVRNGERMKLKAANLVSLVDSKVRAHDYAHIRFVDERAGNGPVEFVQLLGVVCGHG